MTSAPDEVEWLASRPGHFTPGKSAPGTQWMSPELVWKLWRTEKYFTPAGK
jgi:hypothetical protein